MPADHIDVPPGARAHIEIRLAANSKASSERRMAVSGTPLAGNDQALEIEEATSAENIQKVTSQVQFDWTDKKEHHRFAALERKVGRQIATQEEESRYTLMLKSRRAWIKSFDYMAGYLEEQRERAIIQKMRELQELIKPINI